MEAEEGEVERKAEQTPLDEAVLGLVMLLLLVEEDEVGTAKDDDLVSLLLGAFMGTPSNCSLGVLGLESV